MNDGIIYRLTAGMTSGGSVSVLGTKEVILEAFDEIFEAKQALEGTTKKMIKVEGFHDSSDKAGLTIAVLVENVETLVATFMWKKEFS